nr:hypothetical protein [uncultured Rhodoferax sp.]
MNFNGQLARKGGIHDMSRAFLSFIAMRSKRLGASYEMRAEMVFIVGLSLLALGAVGLAFVIK